jgi:hypothetical protein
VSAARHDEKRSTERPDEEALLDQRIREVMNTGPEKHPAEVWRTLREHARLPLLYPGKFVAYRDTYEGEGDNQRLVRLEVVESSDTLEGLHERVARLPRKVRERLQVVYIDAPHDLPML